MAIEPEFLRLAEFNHVRMFLLLFGWLLVLQFSFNFREQFRFFQTRPAKIYGKAPRLLGRYQMPALNTRQFVLAGCGFVLGLLGAMTGLLPRLFLLLALLCYFFYFSQIVPLAYVQRKTNLLPLVLLILLVAPGLGAPLREPAALWPLWLVKLALAQMYLSAGLQKLRLAGWRWCDGRSLQAYLVEHYLWGDTRAAWWLARQLRLCRWLSVLILAFDLTFGLILFLPKLTYLYALGGVLFHAGTALTMRIHYLKYLGPVYLVFATEWAFRGWELFARYVLAARQ